MRHHRQNSHYPFVYEPVEFNKYTDRHLLQYCLGATLYMPGTKEIFQSILNKRWPELTTMVMCFEDAIPETDLQAAEENVLRTIDQLLVAIDEGILHVNDLPLFIVRVRNTQQFASFANRLSKEQLSIIAAFNFPKFSSTNAEEYLRILKVLNETHGEITYGMPILEEQTIAYKETRLSELIKIKEALERYRSLILNVRVGATDISSCFGVRRGIDYSIYDILTVRDCLSDILNILGRTEADFVISAPVWEYFLIDRSQKFQPISEMDLHTSLLSRNPLVNAATDGLLREIILDKANGFVGKTAIHPSHVKFINGMHAVTREEYEDAQQILGAVGGVMKSSKSNKMNEVSPHSSWARKIDAKAKAYGVIENEECYWELFSDIPIDSEKVLN